MPNVATFSTNWFGTWIHQWRRNFLQPMPENEEEYAFIHARQVDLLYRNFAPSAVGTVFVATLFVFAMWEVVSRSTLIAWLLGMYGVILLRHLNVRRYQHKHDAQDGIKTYKWESRFALGASIAGAMWGVMAMLFIPADNSTVLTLVVLAIAGVSAAGGAMLSSSPRSVSLFLLFALLPLSAVLASKGDRFHLFMGTTVIIYLTVLLAAVSRRQTLLFQSIRMGIENERLKGMISAEKMLAEERERTAAQLAKLEIELQYHEIFVNITDGLLLLDITDDQQLLVAGSNPALSRMLGMEEKNDGKGEVLNHFMPEVSTILEPQLRLCMTGREAIDAEATLEMPDGARVLDLSVIPLFNPKGSLYRLICIARDITVRKQMETLLFEREQAFRHLVQNSPDVIIRYDTQCRRIFTNASHAKVVNRPVSLGKTPTEDWGLPTESEEAVRFQKKLQKILDTHQPEEWELGWKQADGNAVCYMVRGVPEFDRQGNLVSVLTSARDISERVRLEEDMRRHASYDALTGLPNRRMFNDRLLEEMARTTRNGTQLALLFIDLDRFKEVNDTLGHEAGDLLLKEAAQRIQGCIRESDKVARLGGDEFVAILTDLPDLSSVGRAAQQIIDSITAPFVLQEKSAYVSASIGIAGFPMDANSADSLIASADHAMYAAKEKGRNTFSFFTQTMQHKAQSRVRLANDLRVALVDRQLEVYYQPIVSVATGKVVKAEALLRWQHPELGWVSPEEFIPVAEETGAIHEIGAWVFRQAVIMALDWKWLEQKAGKADPTYQISINISPRQFSQDRFDEILINYLQAMDVDPARVVIEITEGLLLNDHLDVTSKLQNFHNAGIKIALDDFGTGYSAMGYLKKFNIDYLKIDRSFVRDLERDPQDRAIAEAIVAMSRRLGLKTIAEGVETLAQQNALSEFGCEFIQGYLHARPMPAESFLEFMSGRLFDQRNEPS